MAKILIIHGAGMNMRGKVQIEIFGPMTLPEYDERIRGYAAELGVDIEIFHSNIEGEVVNKLYEANDRGFDAALFNPAGFSRGYPALVAAISQVKFPTIEVHISNPVRRGPVSDTATVSRGMVTGFRNRRILSRAARRAGHAGEEVEVLSAVAPGFASIRELRRVERIHVAARASSDTCRPWRGPADKRNTSSMTLCSRGSQGAGGEATHPPTA